jgi:hypothetical protein
MPGDGTAWITWAEQQDYELVARSHATGHSSAAASRVAASCAASCRLLAALLSEW